MERGTDSTLLDNVIMIENFTTTTFWNSGHSDRLKNVTWQYLQNDSTMADYESKNTTGYIYTPAEADYPWLGAYLIMAFLGFVLNLLVILAIGFGNNVNKEVKTQMINLSIADLIMAIFESVYLILNTFGLSFPNSLALCKVYLYLRRISNYVGLLISLVISIERFVIVFFPFKVAQYTQTHKFLAMTFAWICSAIIAIDRAVDGDILLQGATYHCLAYRSTILSQIEIIWLIGIEYLVPSVIIITLYTLAFIKISLQKISVARCHSSRRKEELFKVRFLLVTTLIVLLPLKEFILGCY